MPSKLVAGPVFNLRPDLKDIHSPPKSKFEATWPSGTSPSHTSGTWTYTVHDPDNIYEITLAELCYEDYKADTAVGFLSEAHARENQAARIKEIEAAGDKLVFLIQHCTFDSNLQERLDFSAIASTPAAAIAALLPTEKKEGVYTRTAPAHFEMTPEGLVRARNFGRYVNPYGQTFRIVPYIPIDSL